MLVDYLEESAEFIEKKRKKYQELGKQYHKVYQKDIREEMDRVKKKIRRRRAGVREKIMEHMGEFRCIKKYYPELFITYLEDNCLGPTIKRMEWLAEIKPINLENAVKKLDKIREKRAQLRDAKGFLKKWVGPVNAKSFGAAYPVLKGHLKGDMDKEAVAERIETLQKKFRKEGWKIIVSSPHLLGSMLERLMARLNHEKLEAKGAKEKYEDAKDRGSVREYNALLKMKSAKRKISRTERHMRHLLLSNPELLRAIKKSSIRILKERKAAFEKFVEDIHVPRLNEKNWLKEMRKRLE